MFRSIRKVAAVGFAASVVLGALSAEATAMPHAPNPHKPPAVTMMRFKLDSE